MSKTYYIIEEWGVNNEGKMILEEVWIPNTHSRQIAKREAKETQEFWSTMRKIKLIAATANEEIEF